MIELKGCPRCQGDLYLTEDSFGKFANCLQCGYIRDFELPAENSSTEEVANCAAVTEEVHGVAA